MTEAATSRSRMGKWETDLFDLQVARTVKSPLPPSASGLLAGLIVYPWLFHVPAAMVLSSFAIELKAVDVVLGDVLKCVVYGTLIATVCAYEGLNVRGGAEGVGRAVNRAVVIAFTGTFVFNFALNAILLASFPELQQVR